jgi:hypothetical protein
MRIRTAQKCTWEIGAALIRWGDMTPGDKAITNPGLPKSILEGSDDVKRSYLKEMIPEDGSFHPSLGFIWNRSHAIHAGDKTEDYEFKSPLTPKAIEFIKRHGTKNEGLVERRTLSVEKLQKLQLHKIQNESKAAKRILDTVIANPNRLLDDEHDLAESLGIGVRKTPREIRFYEKSGRVSVRWQARTSTKADTEKWAERCPPNDVKKRKQVEDWLRKRKQ